MMVIITPKKLKADFAISATFEHDGVAYEEKFNHVKSFITYMKRTHDKFICAVNYRSMKIIRPLDVQKGIVE